MRSTTLFLSLPIYYLAVVTSWTRCQSSAAIQNGVVLALWEAADFDNECARTAEPPSGDNWWMIDTRRLIVLRSVRIRTESFDSRKINFSI